MLDETNALVVHLEAVLPESTLQEAVGPRSSSFRQHQTLLRRYRGAAVGLHINGISAAGVLCLAEDGAPFLGSLCFTTGDSECPLFSHALADHEIATLRRNGPRRLTSAIAITCADEVLHADCHA